MSIRWPRLLTPSQLSQIISSQRSPLKALEIFREAKSRYANYRHNGPIYSTIIRMLGNSGRISEMKEVIHQMRDDSCECRDSIFVDAIKTYARAGLTEEAVSLFRSLSQFNCVNWTNSFNTLLEIMVKESELEAVHSLFLQNVSSWEVKSRIKCLNLLLDALCRLKRSDLALNVFQEMFSQCCYPNRESYTILMRGLCEDGRLHEATHLMYSMFWRISQKGSCGDVAVYRILLDALCDNGDVEEAVNLLGKVLRKGLRAPKRARKQFNLSQCYSGGRADVQTTKRLINEALTLGGVPSTDGYQTMAVDLYSEGKIDEGDKVVREMQERGFRSSEMLFKAKVAALLGTGRADDAVSVVEKEMVEKVCVPTVSLYNLVIRGLFQDRKSDLAVGYLRKMTMQIGCSPDHESYSLVADGLCSESKYLEASEILEEMLIRSFQPGSSTYNTLIQGLCSNGGAYKAFMWLEEMTSESKIPDASTWNSLVSSACSDAIPDRENHGLLHILTDSS